MRNIVLQDLALAGVCWELKETAEIAAPKQTPIQQTFSTNRLSVDNSVIIPATAPITLDTVKLMAERPTTIDSLLRMIGEFNHPLRGGATNVVMPNIAQNPNGLLIITDCPNSDDDLCGKILSGNAGDMTDKMLNAINMSRENVSIVPLLFWRTPGGRSPTREELDLSLPFVNKITEMLAPKVIITFGTLPATEIAKINSASGAYCQETTDDYGRIIIPLYHPNYLMLKPSAKKDVWGALQHVENLLKNA